MAVKNFVFVNENQFTWRSGQDYTLSYYQLTFSEPNRLIVSVICAWLSDKSNFSNYKIVENPSSMKQNNWTTSCTQNEAKCGWETLIWLESVTEKVTGSAQTGACVDVLSRCSPDHKICLLFYRKFQPRTQACSRYPSDQRKLGTVKLDRWRHIRNRRGRLGTRLRTCLLRRSEIWKQDQFKH